MNTKKNIRKHRQRKLLSASKQLLLALYENTQNFLEPLNILAFEHHVYGKLSNNYNALYSLKRSGYIKKAKRDKGLSLCLLTEAGIRKAKTMIARETYDEMKRKRKWDGKWRFVMYDIPDEYKKLRDYFRNTLKYLGFVKLQASIWVFPYDTFDILEEIIPDIKKHDWIKLIESDRVVNDKSLWKQFFD